MEDRPTEPIHVSVPGSADDPRVATSIPGVVIHDPGCVAKTYPRFFEDLEKLR